MRAFLVLLLVFTVGCPKRPAEPPTPQTEVPVEPPPPRQPAERSEVEAQEFQRVHFEFDSTAPTPDSVAAMRHNVQILQQFPGVRIEVQGHCDERGTTEYNIGLGQRRAEGIKDRMVRMGVSGQRITTISYGEERPLRRGHGEEIWAENRRAEFRVLTTGENEPARGTVR